VPHVSEQSLQFAFLAVFAIKAISVDHGFCGCDATGVVVGFSAFGVVLWWLIHGDEDICVVNNKEGNDVRSRRISREVNGDKIVQSELSYDLKPQSCKFELLRKAQYSHAFALSECAIYSLNTQSVL
jgi:hypothetical protein